MIVWLCRYKMTGGGRPSGADRAALDRCARATDRLTRQAEKHKARIEDLARQLLLMNPLSGALGVADLAVLGRYADLRVWPKAVRPGLTQVIDHRGVS